MSYVGYSSFDENRSQIEEYDLEREVDPNMDNENIHDLTYEESSRVLHFDVLADLTNKIKISDALTSKQFGQKNKSNISRDIPLCKNRIPKINFKTQVNENNSYAQTNKNITIRPSSQRKSRAASLIYFQQHQNNIKKQNKEQKQAEKENLTQRSIEKMNLPLQMKQLNLSSIKNINTKSNLSIKQGTYFPKNELTHNQSTKQEILLTSRSGFVLSISDAFLQNLTRQYNNPVEQEQEISLKQKIMQKIYQEKKNSSMKLKTQVSEIRKTRCEKSFAKNYKPLKQNECVSSRAILSTQPFYNRQVKTLQNKMKTVQNLKQQKDYSQLKECTFKPKIKEYKKKMLY